MATAYKRKRTMPVPPDAEVKLYRGRMVAEWKDRRGRLRRELVLEVPADAERVTRSMNGREVALLQWADADGQRRSVSEANAVGGRCLLIEDRHWSIQLRDHTGRRTSVGSETSEKAAAERLAVHLASERMERRRGLIDPRQEAIAEAAGRPIQEHLNDYDAMLRAKLDGQKHVGQTLLYIRRFVEASGWETPVDIDADDVNRYVGELTERKHFSASTVNAHITAVKGFTAWLVNHQKLLFDPLAGVKKPNPQKGMRDKGTEKPSGRGFERRALLHAEWDWLRSTTDQSPTRYGMPGSERVLLYGTAIQTGLRANELRSLHRGDLFLATDRPYIRCKARFTKNAKDARQYIKRALAQNLEKYGAGKAPKAPVFKLPPSEDMAAMLRADLAAARAAWLKAAEHDLQEQQRRDESDFLLAVNHAGGRMDFHALRHTTGAWAIAAGANVKQVMVLMRHSTAELTLSVYGHLLQGQEADAVDRLPEMFGDTSEALEATGTDGNAVQHGHQPDAHAAGSGRTALYGRERNRESAAGRKALSDGDLPAEIGPDDSENGDASSRTRTWNPLIKSQLLCQLS